MDILFTGMVLFASLICCVRLTNLVVWLVVVIVFMLSVYTNLIQLTKIFHKYAVKHATLGMTVEEFQQFLIEYQQVRTTK